MVELEILFSSGQGILVPMEDRESALRFMQQAMEIDRNLKVGLFHLSTPYEEVLLDLSDISFLRLKKENYPRLTTKLKIPAHTSFHEQETEHGTERAEHEAAIKHRREAEQQGDERTFMVDPSGNVNTRVSDSYARAEDRLRQAEARLDQVDVQRRKVEADLRRTAEDLEDAVREADLRKNVENLEIDAEIKKMKDQHHG